MTDDLDWIGPEPDDRNLGPRRCVRHTWVPVSALSSDALGIVIANAGRPVEEETDQACVFCHKLRDIEAARRGRNNAKRGKKIQRARIVGLGGQNLPGNKPGHDGIGIAFSYESKSGGFFSERAWRVLRGIPATAQQTRVLIVTDTPGPGHKARSYVVVEYDQWRELHGETAA